MKTVKTFARFSKIGISPSADILYFIISNKGVNRIDFKFFDNRFAEEMGLLSSVNFEEIEKKALELEYVEVPVELAEILEEGNYWGNFSKIESFSNSSEFNEAVKNTAGWDGIPDLK